MTTQAPTNRRDDAALKVVRAIVAAKSQHAAASPGSPFTLGRAAEAVRPLLAELFPKQHKINGRNLLFDALSDACGYGDKPTKTASAQIGAAVAEIFAVCPAVTPEQLSAVAKAVRKKYENSGPKAVSAHFHEFYAGAAKPTQSGKGVYVEPPNWREVLANIAQARKWDADTVKAELAKTWEDVSITLRQEIVKAIA